MSCKYCGANYVENCKRCGYTFIEIGPNDTTVLKRLWWFICEVRRYFKAMGFLYYWESDRKWVSDCYSRFFKD